MATKVKRKNINDYMNLPWSYTVERHESHGGYFVVMVNELPGIMSDGETIEEAFTSIQEPMRILIQDMLEKGEDVPEPVDKSRFKGTINYRTEPEVHYRLYKEAQRRGVSINKLIDEKVREGLKHTG